MTKTPDEIKKGLENCSASEACVNCPYDKRDFPYCVQRMIKDAAERIKQLEKALLLMVHQYCDEGDGSVSHRWMTAGEHAFAALGIDNYCSIDEIDKRLDEMEGRHENAR